MTTEAAPRLDRICALLEAHPEHAGDAAYLKSAKRGAFIVILPSDDNGAWRANLAEFAEKYERFTDAGLHILAVAPEPEPALDFELPFPQVDIQSDLAENIWKILRDLVTFRPFEFAGLLTPHAERIAKEWRKLGPDRLVPEILEYLVDKHFINYTPDPDLVHIVERAHIGLRRRRAAEEFAGSPRTQSTAYRALMDDEGARPPFGMAFSGGGIRAAAFSLGVTQSLTRLRILPWMDYFSSVSGGGFTASNVVSLLSRKNSAGEHFFNTQWEMFPFNPRIKAFRTPQDLEDAANLEENRNYRDASHKPGHNNQLKHLFNQANYIIPRIGLASRDLLRGLGALLPGMGFTLLLFALAVVTLAGMHFFAAGLAAPSLFHDKTISEISGLAGALFDGGLTLANLSFDLFLMGAAAGLLIYGFLVAQYSFPLTRPRQAQKTPPSPEKPDPDDEDEDEDVESGEQDPSSVRKLASLRLQYTLSLLGFLAAGLAAWGFGWQLTGGPGGVFTGLTIPGPTWVYFLAALGLTLFLHNDLLGRSLQITRAQDPEIRFGAIFPHPRGLVPMALLFLLQAASAFLLLAGRMQIGGWVYPVVLAAGGGLVLLLTSGAFSDGIIAWPRWMAAVIIIALIVLGAGVLFADPGRLPESCGSCLPWTALPAAALLFALLAVGAYRRKPDAWGDHGLNRWEKYDRWILRSLALLLVGAMLIALVLAQAKTGPDEAGLISWVWAPAVFMAGALAVFALIRLVVTGRRVTWGSPGFRTMIWAAIGLGVYAVAGSLLFALLTAPHMLSLEQMDGTSGTAIPLGSAILSALWAVFLARFSGRDTGGEGTLKRMLALPAGIRNAALGALVIVFWVSLVFLVEIQLDRLISDGQPLRYLAVALVALGLLLLFGILLNYNYLSLHHFWGDRIVDVFLRTTAEDREGRIVTLRDETRYPLRSISQPSGSTPYHLVVTALNLAGSVHQRDRDRKSRHFIFSREFVGSDATGYVPTSIYRGGDTKYGSTIALSGAAVSPGIGTFTFFAQSFMLTLFNVRLGQWWLNPEAYRGLKLSDTTEAQLEEYESRAFWPLYLVDEAFAATSARRRLVNLTDGGHTRDNGGIYPLLERRCKVIIAADASQDPTGLCPDLFSALHYARIDFDVHVEIDVSRLQPAPETVEELGIVEGMSEAHLAVGRIHYPSVHRRDGSVKYPAEKGWLIYVKPAVSDEMPFDILQFWQTDPAMFPHPTTADQFFSERQLEAQRRLGEESITRSLEILTAAYDDAQSGLKDPGKRKRKVLQSALGDGQIDYRLLQRRPALLDEILQDLMRTVSPVPGEDDA